VLLAKGVSPGAVLAGLLLGPATNIATVGWLRRVYGGRATFAALAGLIGATWLVAFGVNIAGLSVQATADAALAHGHGVLEYGAGVVLAILIVRTVWRDGMRAWLGALGESLAGHGSMDSQGHVHTHPHHHHGPDV
jgi:hypothetical protein